MTTFFIILAIIIYFIAYGFVSAMDEDIPDSIEISKGLLILTKLVVCVPVLGLHLGYMIHHFYKKSSE